MTSLLMALLHRKRTGRGTEISVAAAEVGINSLGPLLLDCLVTGRSTRGDDFPAGNRHPFDAAAPHGVYPCRERDTWCAIAVFGDDEWARFRDALGNPPWSGSADLTSHPGRLAHQDELDGHITAWTREREPHEVMAVLQAKGVRAAAVQTCADIHERDPQVRARSTFVSLDHPVAGAALFEGVPVRFSRTPPEHWRSTPLLGEDVDFVSGELLGFGADAIGEYRALGVL